MYKKTINHNLLPCLQKVISILGIVFFCSLAHSQSKYKMGIFVHYLCSLQNSSDPWNQGKKTSWSECVANFNVDSFANEVKKTGADYVIFTLQQQDKYFCIPNYTYEKLTGYNRGDATCNRDLINDLYNSLHRRNIKLFLYITGDGPYRDEIASKALNHPVSKNHNVNSFKVDYTWVNTWSTILRNISLTYGTKIAGWWVDGCYPFIGYNNELLKQIYEALKSGNPNALIALNGGASYKVANYAMSNMSAGESSDILNSFPPSKKLSYQWHTLTFLGKNWAQPGIRYTPNQLADYIKKVSNLNGMVSIDVCLLRDGHINREQLLILQKVRSLLMR